MRYREDADLGLVVRVYDRVRKPVDSTTMNVEVLGNVGREGPFVWSAVDDVHRGENGSYETPSDGGVAGVVEVGRLEELRLGLLVEPKVFHFGPYRSTTR